MVHSANFSPEKMLNISPLVGLFCMVLAIYATKCQGHPALDCIRCIYESLRYISMGIVKISDLLHDDIRDASKAMSRSVNAQAEYWIRLGMMSELYPELNHQQIKLLMLKSGSDRLLEVINAINNH